MIEHELNTRFQWHDCSGPFRYVTDDQARQYNDLGYFTIEGAFDAQTIAELVAEIDPLEAQAEALVRDRFGGKVFIMRADEITFTTHLVTRSEKARAFTRSRIFCDLAHDLIGPDARLYWDQSVYKKPGTEAPFPWHQDNGYTFIEPQQYLTCWVALTDADEANGCPWVLPGAHRAGTYSHRLSDLGFVCVEGEPEGAVPAPVRSGGMVVFSSLTPHSTGPNLTDRVRKSYIVQLAVDGAELVKEDGTRERCDAPERQYPIVIGGEPVR